MFCFFFFLFFCFFFFFFFQAEDGIRDRDVTGVQTCALPISIVTAERAQLRISHNNIILAKREEYERTQLNADAQKTQTEMHPGIVSLPVQSDIAINIHAIKSSNASEPSLSLPNPGSTPLHPGILEGLGIDLIDHSSKPKAPQHALAAQKTKKLVAEPIQQSRKTRPSVDHQKGFKKAVGDLSVALTVKPDRNTATNALAKAAYHCSGAFDVHEQDDKITIIRQHVVKAARQLYDKFILSLSAIVRSKIFDRSPPAANQIEKIGKIRKPIPSAAL
mgnify:CR=1 FL=1